MDKREIIIESLKKHQVDFHPVVHFDPATDKLAALDFTAANTSITPDILNDIDSFSGYIEGQLQQNNARYGIGGYGEHRTIYKVSKVFDGDAENEEPRRLHLGIDIWGKQLTAIMSPMDGIVHSFAFNNNFGDYGATIILVHRLDDISFFTLYGHLSLNSIKNLNKGQRIERGETFCEFGIPIENGHWPPHLHFQLIIDIENYEGDYPGVCKFSEKGKWLMNSPDADLVLQMNQYI
jgi:murein DD-endopeptidase MepM/ murein hydrolase activator NlpD